MSILTSFGYLEKEAKVLFDRLTSVIATTQPIRLNKIKTLQYEVQYLQDHLLELKEQEKAYLRSNNILSSDISDQTKFETLPEFTRENKASFYLSYQPKNILDNDTISKTDGVTYSEPELERYRSDALDKIGDVDKYLRYWNHRIKYVRLLIEKKFSLIEELISEQETSANG